MTNSEGRTVYLETRIKWLTDQLTGLQDSVLALQSQARLATASVYPGGGGGGGSGAFVAITPAIAAGGSGTADVSQLTAGTFTTFAAGATIWNPYLSSTVAGRIVTLCQNPDQSFTIYGQSCS